MTTATRPLVDDDTLRRLTVLRVLLERAYDDLEMLEREVDGALRERLGDVSTVIALALDEVGERTILAPRR